MSVVVLGVAAFLLGACSWRYHENHVDLLLLGAAFGGVSWELRRSFSFARDSNGRGDG